jgi:hypothetical protein
MPEKRLGKPNSGFMVFPFDSDAKNIYKINAVNHTGGMHRSDASATESHAAPNG